MLEATRSPKGGFINGILDLDQEYSECYWHQARIQIILILFEVYENFFLGERAGMRQDNTTTWTCLIIIYWMRLPPPNDPNGIPIKSLDLQLLWLEGKMNLWSNILYEGWKRCKCLFMALWGHLHTFQSCCSAQLLCLFSQNIKTNSKDNQCLPFHGYFNFFVRKKNFYQNINGLGKLFWVQNMIMKDICHLNWRLYRWGQYINDAFYNNFLNYNLQLHRAVRSQRFIELPFPKQRPDTALDPSSHSSDWFFFSIFPFSGRE